MMISGTCLKAMWHRPLYFSCVHNFLRSTSCSSGIAVQNIPSVTPRIVTCCVHTTSQNQYPGQEWRKKFGKPKDPYSYGPLTDGPDYSFLDGRPTPVGTGRLKRAQEQKEISERLLKLNAEVDFAVANHAARTQEENERKAKILQNKLKSKGSISPEVKS